MMRVNRTESEPTAERRPKSLQTMGACRPFDNRRIAANRARPGDGLPFQSAYRFARGVAARCRGEHPGVTAASGKARTLPAVQAQTATREGVGQ
jgi:hypothetical protein